MMLLFYTSQELVYDSILALLDQEIRKSHWIKYLDLKKKWNLADNYHYMSTIILVDRIGEGSRISEMAKKINGDIVQMSMTHWTKEVAEILKEKIGFKHPILDLSNSQSLTYIKKEMKKINLREFI